MNEEIRQSDNAKRLDLKKALAILKQSESPEAARQLLENPLELELCKRAALVRAFDREMFDSVLAAGLDLTDPATVFDRFIERPGIERIPRTNGLYRFKDSSRQEYLKAWETEETEEREIPAAQAAFSRKLVDFYQKRQGESPEEKFDLLASLLLVDQARAQKLFISLYDEADRRFDLPTCQTALRIMENRYKYLSNTMRRTLHDKRRHYRSRSLYAPEYYQTISYYPRDDVLGQFQDLVKHPSKWIFHLYAKGGMGKTMFLRWLASRHCVPEPQRIPVARLDFDFIHLPLVQAYPWLLLQPLAAQLNEQIDGYPFNELLEGSEGLQQFAPLLRQLLKFEPERVGEEAEESTRKDDAVWRNFRETERKEREQAESRLQTSATFWSNSALERFNSALSEAVLKTPLVIILDTLEEMTLTQRAALLKILENLAAIHVACPKTRLILSGRYDLRERITEFNTLYCEAQEGQEIQAECVELAKFNKAQAIGYLSEKRHLKGQGLLEAIYERADQGNPFKLALFADMVSSRQAAGEQLSEQEVRDLPDADFAYLIDRIVRRLPEQEMRWVLRYGAIPRMLTREFFEQVMVKYLKRVIAEPELDRPNEKMPEEARSYEGRLIWRDLSPENDQLAVNKIWERLQQYASGYGWVTYESHSDSFTFHSEVRAPIRKLLLEKKVYRPLQKDAVKYFESRAKDDKGRWAEWTGEAFYHLNQIDGARALGYWREKLDSPRGKSDPAARKQLAKEILKPDYEEEAGLRAKDDAEFVGLSTVAQACVALAADPKRRSAEWSEARQHLDLLRQRHPDRLDELHLSLEQIAECLTSHRNIQAPPLIEKLLGQEIGAELRLSLEIQLADLMNETKQPDAGKHYRAALSLIAKGDSHIASEYSIRVRLAAWHAARGDFADAESEYRQALAVRLTYDEQFEPRIQLAELHLNHSQIEKALDRVAGALLPGTSPNWIFRLSNLRARIELASYDPFKAIEFAQNAEPPSDDRQSQAAKLELLGQISGELMDFERAISFLEDAKKMWKEIGDEEAQYRCYQLMAEIQLYGVGNLKETSDCLEEWMQFVPHMRCEPELRLRLIDVALKLRYDQRDEAKALWRDTLGRVSDSPRLTALTLASGLARGLAEDADVKNLLDNWKKIEPREARLAALEPFKKFAEENTGEEPPSLKIDKRTRNKLIECVMPPKDEWENRGFLSRAVALSYFYLWLGAEKESLELLEAARAQAENAFAQRAVACARDSWEKIGSPVVSSQEISDNYLGIYPNLRAAITIEKGERLLRREEYASLDQVLNVLRDLIRENPPTQWRARLEALRGRILLSQGDDSGRDHIQTASVIYARLGDRLKERRVISENDWAPDLSFGIKTPVDLESPTPAAPESVSSQIHEPHSCVITFEIDGDKKQYLSSDLIKRLGKSSSAPKRTQIQRRLQTAKILPEAFQPSFSLFNSNLHGSLLYNVANIGREMGAFLITPDEMDEIRGSAGNFDLQLSIPHSLVSALPWELARAGDNRPLGAIFQSISRTSKQTSPLRPTIKWAQQAANLLLDKSIKVDGIYGRITRAAVEELQRLLNIDEPGGQLSRATIQKLREAQSKAMRGMRLRAVIVQPGEELGVQQYRGYEQTVLDLERFYSSHNIEAVTFSAIDWRRRETELIESGPQILHMIVRMELESRGGKISVDLGERYSKMSVSLGAREINSVLKRLPDDRMRPLVILDVSRPPGITEAVRQLLLRNQFATQLFNLENTGGVLGAGLARPREHEEILQRLLWGLGQGQSRGSVVSGIRRAGGSQQSDMMEDVIGTQCALLLTLDPALSIIPAPISR